MRNMLLVSVHSADMLHFYCLRLADKMSAGQYADWPVEILNQGRDKS